MINKKSYLGDGVYAEYDGGGIWLRANSPDSEKEVYLEPVVHDALNSFREDCKPKPRDFMTVLQGIHMSVPAGDPLREQLIEIKDVALYKAPECMSDCWDMLGYALTKRFPEEPTGGWEKIVVDIFMDRES